MIRVAFFRSFTIAGSICHTAKNSLRESEILAVLQKNPSDRERSKKGSGASNLLDQLKRESRHP